MRLSRERKRAGKEPAVKIAPMSSAERSKRYRDKKRGTLTTLVAVPPNTGPFALLPAIEPVWDHDVTTPVANPPIPECVAVPAVTDPVPAPTVAERVSYQDVMEPTAEPFDFADLDDLPEFAESVTVRVATVPPVTRPVLTITEQVKAPESVVAMAVTEAVAAPAITEPAATSNVTEPSAVPDVTGHAAVLIITTPVAVNPVTEPVAVQPVTRPVASPAVTEQIAASKNPASPCVPALPPDWQKRVGRVALPFTFRGKPQCEANPEQIAMWIKQQEKRDQEVIAKREKMLADPDGRLLVEADPIKYETFDEREARILNELDESNEQVRIENRFRELLHSEPLDEMMLVRLIESHPYLYEKWMKNKDDFGCEHIKQIHSIMPRYIYDNFYKKQMNLYRAFCAYDEKERKCHEN